MVSQDHLGISLAYLPATKRDRRVVLLAGALLVVAFCIAAPFAQKPLPRLNSFIPTIEGMIFVNDLITSILLFAQYSTTPSRSLLILASGYLFTAFIIIPHVLAFPGALTPTGLLLAGLQSAPWIYYFWHLGFPILVIAYACNRRPSASDRVDQRTATARIIWSATAVLGTVCGLTLLATAGKEILPPILADELNTVKTNLTLINSLTALVVAAALIAVWIRRSSVLDYWLMLVLLAIISELVLSNTLNATRFSLGYYVGRAFSLATSIFVLGLLLSEMTWLYAQLVSSNQSLERERKNKLMNVEATTAAIAHEIKQPLAAMALNAESSLEFLDQTPPDLLGAKEALKDIVADGHRTSDALDGMRVLFREINEERQLVDVNEIATSVLHGLRGELIDHGVTTQLDLIPEIPLVHGNRGQLQQVIFNLVHNAIEAMAGMSDRSRVLRLITQRQDSDRIVVAVQDTGPGIKSEQMDRVFDAFVTTKSQGTGLGLAICRVIIERHGGLLSASSDGKSGALFQFVLPIKLPGEATTRS